jgi:hypothetical protein
MRDQSRSAETAERGVRSLAMMGGGALLAVLFFSGSSSQVLAAPINYGTHAGIDVIFGDVSEEAGAGDVAPLFGAPTVTGNSIDFNPVGFDAASQNGGNDQTVSSLSFTLSAKPGSWIRRITFSGAGDTTLAGNVAPGSTDTATAVSASGTIEVHEVNFLPVSPAISAPFTLTFSPSGGTYFLGTDGGGGPIFHTQWTGSVTIPVEDILIANGISAGATRIVVDLDHSLTAASQAGTAAGIEVKDFGGIAVRVDVPEPGALVCGAGLAVLVLRRRGRGETGLS